MSDKIEVNYEELSSLSMSPVFDRMMGLAQIRDKLKQKKDDLLDSGWAGEAADKFKREMETTSIPYLLKLEGVLEELSSKMKRVAAQMKESEEQAGNLFKG